MLTRRRFLQLTGITVVASRFDPLRLFTTNAVLSSNRVYGRALEAAPVYARPTVNWPVRARLWPDSVTPIVDVESGWYRLPDGYTQRSAMQPVRPYTPQTQTLSELPFWAEVAAPIAVVRKWCAADAPLVTRIGHGGVMRVVDSLNGWYSLASETGDLLGWTQAVMWQVVSDQQSAVSGQQEMDTGVPRQVEINLRAQELMASENGQAVLRAPISTGMVMTPGAYFVRQRQVGGGLVNGQYGVPWMTELDGDFTISGVYWHNRFGSPTPGPAVQVTPMLARWLYDWLGDGVVVVNQ